MTSSQSAAPQMTDRDAARTSTWSDQLLRRPASLFCLVMLALLTGTAIFAPVVAPYHPEAVDTLRRLQGPSLDHWLGTDSLGRDVLSRVIYGARVSLGAAVVSVALAAVAGTSIGLLTGYLGGWWDSVAMRVVDALQSIPALVFAFAIIALVGKGIVPTTLAVAVIFAIAYIRIARGVMLRERQRRYVDAATVAGLPTPRIIFGEILPNMIGPLVVETAILLGSAQLIIAMLSFLGLGVDADAADWGSMLNDARIYQGVHPFLSIPSGLAITFSVLLFNVLGDDLRDILTGTRRPVSSKRARPATAAQPVSVATDVPSAAEKNDTAGTASILDVSGLTIEFPIGNDGARVLDGVSFSLRAGETFGLVGESGSGKSQTALAILGLTPKPGVVTGGSVHFGGRDLAAAGEHELQRVRGAEIAMIFQDPMAAFSPVHTIGDQIIVPLQAHKKLSRAAARDRAVELLDRVGVPNARLRLDDYPHQFSGGMAQRAMIAMALTCEPKVLLADEPTTALDVTIQAQVLDLMHELQQEMDMAILLITHDLGVVAATCDRVGVMYSGQIVETGNVADVFDAPRHPYTRALMEATPHSSSAAGGRLPTIDGRVPPPWNLPQGCRFHPRCRFAIEACTISPVPLVAGSRCLRAGELAMVEA
ncbi:dipeptide/oligopeptide/nickel ABC transporter permease/ATP-binding protein [Mesorhizobium sp. CAU 1732]|uniref:dipeptide/oligopeptide/nickel ABC transporter permease/ATP-binding protein n=1 Tax=Mesorhizobium sp. CAU 1732 TaxID=3140358 RepID=UPI003261D1E4